MGPGTGTRLGYCIAHVHMDELGGVKGRHTSLHTCINNDYGVDITFIVRRYKNH